MNNVLPVEPMDGGRMRKHQHIDALAAVHDVSGDRPGPQSRRARRARDSASTLAARAGSRAGGFRSQPDWSRGAGDHRA
ncbi:MAG: hypothetical protein QM736_04955 [Vicinamibacterales bacterium]